MIKLNKICKTYNKGRANEFQALRDISLEISDGEMIAIVGKSGAGKSTLLHILACIDSFDSGEFTLDDRLIKKLSEREYAKLRNEKIGIVMQDFALVEDFSVIENVMLPLDFSRKRKKNKRASALSALTKVGIADLAEKPVKQLSGGQKQRTAIARAIVNNPQIILADEPTGALDSKTSAEIIGILRELNESGKTVIIVTHDNSIAQGCERVITIGDGRIISDSAGNKR